MKEFFHRLIKFFAYVGATIVILLAIAVGLFRLFLPRVPEYQDEIKAWASAAIGMQVEFSGMDARWGLSGPELEFYDAELIRIASGVRIVAAQEVRVGVALTRLLFEQALVVDRLVIRDTSVDVRELEDGSYRIQGITVSELLDSGNDEPPALKNIEVIGEDIEVRFMRPEDERPHFFVIPRIAVSVDDNRIAVDADIRLPDDLGRQLSVSATQILSAPVSERSWDIFVDADDIRLAGWSELSRSNRQFQSGIGDMELALAVTNGQVSAATAELDFVDIALANDDFFDLSGRIEVDLSDRDWLVAAHEFVISRQDHEWPESEWRVEASIDESHQVVMLDARASYLDLGDLLLLQPWLDDAQGKSLGDFAPSGIVRDVTATVSNVGSDEPRFNISADLFRVGFAAVGSKPGIRGFSGLVRATHTRGRVEINATDIAVHVPNYLSDPVEIGLAEGTVIWRNSNNRITVFTDNVVIESDFFDSESNGELTWHKDGSSPEIDFASSWSISDVAAAKRYIPQKALNPKLYEWFQMALVSGSIPRGTTTLNGPLDKFPFDGGEGRLLMEASVRNMTFKYHALWPAAEQ